MATVEGVGVEQRFRLYGISWQTYLELRDAPENEHVDMTYNQGELEMMAPSKSHAQYASLMDLLIHVWAWESDVDIQSCRDMTCQRKDLRRGFEPDNCYYVRHEAVMRSKTELDLSVDPPPDLAIEIDLGGKGTAKLAIYAAFGVPEVWWFDGRELCVFVLGGDGQYHQRSSGVTFPNLPPAEIEKVLAKLGTTSETALVRSFRDWVLTQTTP